MFTLSPDVSLRRTEGSESKAIFVTRPRTEAFKGSFQYQGSFLWNHLPEYLCFIPFFSQFPLGSILPLVLLNHFYVTVYRLTLCIDIIVYLKDQFAEGFPSLK